MSEPEKEILWDVTTTIGSILRLPAPLKSTGQPWQPDEFLNQGLAELHERAGQLVALNPQYIVQIQAYTQPAPDPERLTRAQMRASGNLSRSSSSDSPAAVSPSATSGSPSGRSTTDTGSRTTRR